MKFRSPKYEDASISIPPEAANLQATFNGTVCSNKGDAYEIRNNIIDFLDGKEAETSFAQNTNRWNLTAGLYENLWRNRSLSLFSGTSLPVEKEQRLLIDWMNPQPDDNYLDVGCSTALYARTLKKAAPNCKAVALDLSQPMLQQARTKAKAAHLSLHLLRADARFLPFYAGTFNGLVMGGTLNELYDPLKVLFECRRVLNKNGSVFMMHLTKAQTWPMRLIQQSTEYSGLQFWDLDESNHLFERAGFSVSKQNQQGIVCFTKLKPA